MPWFKGDDGWHKHRKRIRSGLDMTGLAAQGLWFAAGTWCANELTDGWVPCDVVDYLAPGLSPRDRKKLVERLVRAGLWVEEERDGETGWIFHDWTDRNPTRKQVEEEREAAAQRQRNARDRARQARRSSEGRSPEQDRESQRESRRDTRVTNGVTPYVTHGVSTVPPTRPGPTRPELPTEVQNQEPLALSVSLPKQDHPEVEIEPQTAPTETAAERQRRKRYCDEHYSPDDRDCTGCHNDHGDCGYWSKRPAGQFGRDQAAKHAAGEL
jgi:hypothetical protein